MFSELNNAEVLLLLYKIQDNDLVHIKFRFHLGTTLNLYSAYTTTHQFPSSSSIRISAPFSHQSALFFIPGSLGWKRYTKSDNMPRSLRYFDDRSFDKYFDDLSFEYTVKDKTWIHGHLEYEDTHVEEDVPMGNYKKSQAIPTQTECYYDRTFYDRPKDETYRQGLDQFATEKARHQKYREVYQATKRQVAGLPRAHKDIEQEAADLRNARLAEVMERRRQREEDERIRLELEEQEWVRAETERLKEQFRERKLEQEEEERRKEDQWKTWKQEEEERRKEYRKKWKQERQEWQEPKNPNLKRHPQRQEPRFKDERYARESTPRSPWSPPFKDERSARESTSRNPRSSPFYPWTEPRRKENRRDWTPKQQHPQAHTYTSQLPSIIQSGPTYSSSTDYSRWTAACESMHITFKFPDPPTYNCGLALKRPNACMSHSSLQACQHDLEKMLRVSGEYNMGFLRKLTIMFHPDKFSRWPEEGGVRKQGQEKAKEMFQLLRRLMVA